MEPAHYYRLALQQQVLYQQQLEELIQTEEDIQGLKTRIAARHKKHRRCDKEIQKEFQCPYCERTYASDIALKLHFKLKHQKAVEDRTGGFSTEEEQAHLAASNSEPVGDSNLVA